MKFYGLPRLPISRLLATAYPGNATVYLQPSLGWMPGDNLGFAPSTMRYLQSD